MSKKAEYAINSLTGRYVRSGTRTYNRLKKQGNLQYIDETSDRPVNPIIEKEEIKEIKEIKENKEIQKIPVIPVIPEKEELEEKEIKPCVQKTQPETKVNKEKYNKQIKDELVKIVNTNSHQFKEISQKESDELLKRLLYEKLCKKDKKPDKKKKKKSKFKVVKPPQSFSSSSEEDSEFD